MKDGELLARVRERLGDAACVKLEFLDSGGVIAAIAKTVASALAAGRRGYIFGNGGSAADAQHIAAEMEGRYLKERRPWPVLALTTNSSSLTCIGNDYGYDQTFVRPVKAYVKRGDVVIAISTSGNSPNVLEAVKAARKQGAKVIGFTGQGGGKLKGLCDHCLCAPSTVTARIQECHITAGHIVCEMLDEMLPR
jgi:D-sedoheptulose 7-phosphate isomerase